MIAPSILSANFASLKDLFPSLEQNGVEILHFDVMDNNFVPNLTFGHQFIKDLRSFTSLPFDVHLMINNPAQFIPLYVDAGTQYISAHIEAFKQDEEIYETISYLHQNKVLFGLALKPNNPISIIEKFLPELDYILVMTVEPGFGGQALIPETLKKIQELDQLRKKDQLSFKIQADGGINAENMLELTKLGTDILVMGSGFFNYSDPYSLIKKEKTS